MARSPDLSINDRGNDIDVVHTSVEDTSNLRSGPDRSRPL